MREERQVGMVADAWTGLPPGGCENAGALGSMEQPCERGVNWSLQDVQNWLGLDRLWKPEEGRERQIP